MKRFTVTVLAAALLLSGIVSAQILTSTFPSSPLPSAPPNSQPDIVQYIADIPSCWAGCVGGAIKEMCPTDDSWTCACTEYWNNPTANPNFILLATEDPACVNTCPPDVGLSDGGEQST